MAISKGENEKITKNHFESPSIKPIISSKYKGINTI
jgi:hypothetical protein